MRACPRLHSQVDAALRECSLVDAGLAAAVALPRDGSGAVLVGLVAPARAPGGVAPHAWDALSERVARCVAARHLPMHAVPARVLALPTSRCDDNSGPALPLNANGKVDRHALRSFAEAAVSSSAGARSARAGDEGPSTTQSFDRPYEATVRSVWRSLGLNPRSPSDGFACLGGDSLMAARAAKMLHHRATGVKFDESAPEDVRLFGMVRGAFAAEHVIAKSSLREYAAFVSSAQEREQTERQAAGGAGLAEAGGQSADGVEAAAALDIDIDAGSEATEADVLLADAAAACRLDALISLLHDGGASPDGPWRRVNKTRPHALVRRTTMALTKEAQPLTTYMWSRPDLSHCENNVKAETNCIIARGMVWLQLIPLQTRMSVVAHCSKATVPRTPSMGWPSGFHRSFFDAASVIFAVYCAAVVCAAGIFEPQRWRPAKKIRSAGRT